MAPLVTHKLSRWALVAFVIGSLLDSGIYSLPATFARATGVLGSLIAWGIAGSGMLMLVFIFQELARRKPKLDAGVFSYAQDGFGNYAGFLATFGFWAGTCVGCVSYLILIKSALSFLLPAFGPGNTVMAVLSSTSTLWAVHFLILRGIRDSALINSAATGAKVLITLIFLFFISWHFHPDIFLGNFWGAPLSGSGVYDLQEVYDYGFIGYLQEIRSPAPGESLFFQVRRTMLVAAYVFVGVEGAIVFSRFAKNREDIGFATKTGFLTVLLLFVLVTTISYGILERNELATLRQPSLAGIMDFVDRGRSAVIARIGLIITIVGAYLAWILLAVEVLFIAARGGTMPTVLGRLNPAGVPSRALWLTTILIQLLLLVTLFIDYAYGVALELTSTLIMVPYLLIAGYALKLAWSRETYENTPFRRNKKIFIACAAILYILFVLWSGGIKYTLLACLLSTLGSSLFILARIERKLPIFTTLLEKILFASLLLGCFTAIIALSTGFIRP